MLNASTTPPVPAPRNKTHQRMNSSSSAAGNSSSIGDAPSHTSPARKPKSSHPWLTLVHPGPWKLLPPAAPVTPPASSWFKPRAPPRNPFGEVADDDAGEGEETAESTGQTQPNPPGENAPDDDPQNKPSDGDPAPTRSQSDADDAGEENKSTDQKTNPAGEKTPNDDPQNKPSDGDPAGSQSDGDDAASKSDGEERTPAEKPVPPKRRGSRGGTPRPASEDSTLQRDDESTDPSAPSGTGRTADDASDASDAPPDANTVRGVPELEGIASGIPDWKGAAKSLGAAVGLNVAGVAGALGVDPDDAAGGLNPFEEPDFSDAAGAGLGIPHLGGENGMGGLGGGGLSGLGEVPDLPGAGAAKSFMTSDALPLTKSASVPAISSALPQNPFTSDALPEETTESFSKVCKENPFDRTPGMPKSQTFQTPPPKRATAPGYGFPLIKRKVQTDSVAPVGDLEEEMGQLDRQVETLDLKGMELEKKLRNSQRDDDEEKMLMDWLTIIRQKHVLVRRDAELLYLTKQKHLEERQADVEYGLRCLLNKPESDWSQEDRGREQQLMDELVTVIEQRNHIISSLDEDRQSEREEDLLFEAMMKRKDLQKEGLKELKKSRGKFKLMKVLKMLSQKSDTAKDPKDKKKS